MRPSPSNPYCEDNGVMAADFELRLANVDDLDGSEQLIESARRWLRSKGTDQWQRPWPDYTNRIERVRIGLAAGKTWVLADGRTLVAMITVDWKAVTEGLPELWNKDEQAEPAAYDHRMAVLRDPAYAGRGLGEQLLDWTGRLAAEAYGARYVRLDAWTTNTDLHRYYKEIGFDNKHTFPEEEIDCPSGALFEKPTERCTRPLAGIAVNDADVARWTAASRTSQALVTAGR